MMTTQLDTSGKSHSVQKEESLSSVQKYLHELAFPCKIRILQDYVNLK
jgi:hypothetical protein